MRQARLDLDSRCRCNCWTACLLVGSSHSNLLGEKLWCIQHAASGQEQQHQAEREVVASKRTNSPWEANVGRAAKADVAAVLSLGGLTVERENYRAGSVPGRWEATQRALCWIWLDAMDFAHSSSNNSRPGGYTAASSKAAAQLETIWQTASCCWVAS